MSGLARCRAHLPGRSLTSNAAQHTPVVPQYLWRAKQPYNVSVAAETAACAALTNMPYLDTVSDAELGIWAFVEAS